MRARLLSAALFAVLALPLLFTSADPVLLQSLTVQRLLQDIPLDDAERGPIAQVEFAWTLEGDVDGHARADAIRAGLRLPRPEDGEADPYLSVDLENELFLARIPERAGATRTLLLRTEIDEALGRLQLVDVAEQLAPADRPVAPLGSRWALLPPLLAILLAFLLRGTLIALSAGVLLGAGMIAAGEGQVLGLFEVAIGDILFGEILTSSFHLYILGFVLLLSSTVAVVTRMGGIDGMVQALLRFAKSSRSVQAIAYALGLGIFFDDYANTIIVGNSCGPLFDRKRVSRAKLAYIVDSTAAPIAGVMAQR